VNLLEALQAFAEELPPGTAVPVPRETILELLSAIPRTASQVDLTVEEVARRFGRSPSTVRGWLASGDLAGYRLRRREWRVPPDALDAFQQRERQRPNPEAGARPLQGSLGDWRSVRGRSTD
jgi:excisionase family DNA binding protein